MMSADELSMDLMQGKGPKRNVDLLRRRKG
jgi:hypothetical protein